MRKVPAWSFSSLNDFQNCPLAYKLKRVTKECPTVESEAMRYGTECHLHLENRMARKTPLPEHLAWMENSMVSLERLEKAYLNDEWPARSSGLCGWCSATRAQCKYAKP